MQARIRRLAGIPGFLALGCAMLMLGVAMSFTAPYLSLFGVEQAGMTPYRLGIFMTLNASSTVLASSLAGRWSDASGRHKPLLLAALAAAALGFALLCVFRNYYVLVATGVGLIGTGGASVSQFFAFARVSLQTRDKDDADFATAALRTLLSAAWVFGPAVGALVLAIGGFAGLFVFAAACFALCAAVVWRAPEAEAHDARAQGAEDGVDTVMTLLPPHSGIADAGYGKVRGVWRAAVAFSMIGLSANVTMIMLPLYIVHELHGTRLDVSTMIGLGALLEIPMMLWLGAKSARLDKPRWLAWSAATHVAYFIAVSWAGRVPVLVPLQALNAIVVAVTSCLGMTYVQELMPRSPGSATALFFNAARVGSVLSGVMSGVVVATFGYRTTFLLCGCMSAAAFVLFFGGPRPAGRPEAASR
jgi:SET family sugar efflux transporter-like MFS transporter